MNRVELLATIKKVAPAISSKTFLPILSHVCFDGEYVTACDDVVAMRTPCKTAFQGCVPGEKLMAVLGASRATEAGFEPTNSEVVLKLGRTRVRFATLSTGKFPFSVPGGKGTKLTMDEQLRGAIAVASKSAGQDSAYPNRLGITCMFSKKKLYLYASDDKTIAKVVTPLESALAGQSFILSPRFCELLLSLGDCCLVVKEDGGLVGKCSGLDLYGKILDNAAPDQFSAVFEGGGLDSIPTAEIPAGFARCLDRALILGEELTTFTYSSGRLNLHTTAAGCELDDHVSIDLGDTDVEVLTRPSYLSRYSGVATRIGITDNCIYLSSAGLDALIGVQAKVK